MSHCRDTPKAAPVAGAAEPKEAPDVPMIEVKLYDRRVTEESVPKMIEALTNALAETSGAAPEHIQVVIQGVDPRHWGIGGQQQS